jgi:hypothetical protein
MNYAREQRLRLIDFLLDQYGWVTRKQIIAFFDVSPAGTTRDFRLYKELAPANILFNDHTKRYIKTESFKSLFCSDIQDKEI